MSVVELMVTIIIVTILVTVILGVVSYGAYWLRRSRRPMEPETLETGPRFFYRYQPEVTVGHAEGDAAPGSMEAEERAEPARRTMANAEAAPAASVA